MTVAAFVLALLAIVLDVVTVLMLRHRTVRWSLELNGHDETEGT